ncbi:MAG: class I SAM-dependent RNA methyltransferase, partial [Halieaceae bacterium]
MVVDLTSDGRGVVRRDDGKVFFTSGAWLEERILVKPTGSKGKIGFGVAEQIIESSPARQPSPCGHHGSSDTDCGGCPWSFVSYEAQCAAKRDRVERALRRLQPDAGIEVELVIADSPWGYRNRVQFKTDG